MPTHADDAKLLRLTRQALGWLLIGAACGLAGCKTTDVPTFSVYDALPGKWGLQHDKELGCDSNPRVISFSEDRKQMTVTYAKPWKTVVGETDTVRYKVLSDDPHLRLFMEGEWRRNPASDRLVAWDLVLRTPDRFCWHRIDWRPGLCTRSIVRCPAD